MIVANLEPRYTWRPLRELQVLFALLLLAFMPLGRMIATEGVASIFIFSAVYGGLVLFVQHCMVNWKCPHCRKPFLRKNGEGLALLYRSRCGNCGIRCGAQAERRAP